MEHAEQRCEVADHPVVPGSQQLGWVLLLRHDVGAGGEGSLSWQSENSVLDRSPVRNRSAKGGSGRSSRPRGSPAPCPGSRSIHELTVTDSETEVGRNLPPIDLPVDPGGAPAPERYHRRSPAGGGEAPPEIARKHQNQDRGGGQDRPAGPAGWV